MLQFRGLATTLGPNLIAARADRAELVIRHDGRPICVRARVGDVFGGEAVLLSEACILLASLDDKGTVEFGHGHSVRFRTSAAMSHRARIELSPTAAVVRDVIGGEGQFAGSVGLIRSNFLISDTGDVTENHLGLIFVRDE